METLPNTKDMLGGVQGLHHYEYVTDMALAYNAIVRLARVAKLINMLSY